MVEIEITLNGLRKLLEASDKARAGRVAFESRMSKINANSSKAEYNEKLLWLSAQGKGGEMKRMIEKRSRR